ncbi:hypothetical protein TNCV_4243941 [Trichonephila clavipes]|nr:hypothetical protein TNCV_4243941 [Trichonephila clavipes]
MTLAECRRPIFACRMIYRSSPAVVVLVRPPPTFLTAVPVVWNAFQALETTLLMNPNSAATLVTCSQLASLDKNNALREIKLRLSYLQGKSTTMSVIAHQTEKEWISANEKSRQRMSQTQAEGAAKQHAARLEEAHLRAHHSCFTTSEIC